MTVAVTNMGPAWGLSMQRVNGRYFFRGAIAYLAGSGGGRPSARRAAGNLDGHGTGRGG